MKSETLINKRKSQTQANQTRTPPKKPLVRRTRFKEIRRKDERKKNNGMVFTEAVQEAFEMKIS